MVVSAVGQAREVPGFADRVGTRLVVPQPSGALLEFLHFNESLSSTPFFEPAVKARLKRLSSFRHAAYARANRLQRDAAHGNRLVLVSAYTPGRRLADMMVLARRRRIQANLPAILSLARQLMTGLALLHDYAPDAFHGAVGSERLVVGPDGRVVITEYVLGDAVEQAVREWGAARLWRDLRVPALDDPNLPRFGRRLDLLQAGMVILSLLVGRPLAAADYPDAVPGLLGHARETTADGESLPLGASLSDWLTRLLQLDPGTSFRTLVEAQKAFARMVDEEPRYRVSSLAVEAFFQQCEEAALLPVAASELEAADSGSVAIPSPSVEPPPPAAAPAPTSPAAASQPDAFVPWPVVVGSDTVATLFETYAPPAAGRESPAAAPPAAGTSGSPAQGAATANGHEEAVGAAADLTSDWLDNTAARSLRESLEALPLPQTPGPSLVELAAGAPAEQPEVAAPEDTGLEVAPAHEWGRPPRPVAELPEPQVEVAPLEPLPPAPMSSGSEPAAERRIAAAATVLSYDEVHRPARQSHSKGLLIAAAVILVVAAGGFASFSILSKPAPAKPAPVTQPQAAAGAELGGFRITTQPPDARVSIDGKALGTAPVRVVDLQPGLHSLTVESEWGTVEEPVTVEAGKILPLSIATVGWVRINAPVALRVSEQGKHYGTTGDGPVMVPAGRHHFELVSQEVAVRLRQFVDVPPGATVTVPIELPAGMLNLSSDQPAQVLLDGQPIGETPMMSVPASLGAHEVIFRSEKYGDVSYTVNVTLAAPVRLTVTFNKR